MAEPIEAPQSDLFAMQSGVSAPSTEGEASMHSEHRRERKQRQSRRHVKNIEKRLSELLAEDERLGRGSVSDRDFFEQHPARQHRLRLATPYEAAAFELCGGGTPGDDLFLWSVIKQVAPGVRARQYVAAVAPPGPFAEIPEHVASGVYQLML